MLFSDYKKHQTVKILLLAVIVITLGVVIVIFIGYRRISKTPELLNSSIREDAQMSIGKIHQTATRNGRKEWSLEAGSGHYIASNNQVILKDLAVTFYLKDKSEVYLTADQGILRTGSNDIEASGNVVIKNSDYRLQTESLNYQHERRIIFANAPLTISGNSTELAANSRAFNNAKEKQKIQITADRLIGEIDAGEFEFYGNVKVTRGNTVVTADRLNIYHNRDVKKIAEALINPESIEKIIAKGNVKISFEDTMAETDKAVYTTKSAVLVLAGKNSRVTRGRNSIAGTKFTLHRLDGRIKVESSGGNRVKAVFYSQ